MSAPTDIAEIDLQTPFRVTDLKQWVYCPRILYYHVCLPHVRPTTYKMQAGIQAGEAEAVREQRRSLRTYGLKQGTRQFDVPVYSSRLGLRGKADMVIWVETPAPQVVVVDYKLSHIAGEHFKLQLAAYALLLEEMSGSRAVYGFLYFIPARKAQKVLFREPLRRRLMNALETMHHMLYTESMPAPTPHRARCVNCEFRLFCNDVF